MIVKRGFTPPPSFTSDRLLKEPLGHFFEVITHGHGVMYSYASRVPPRDRWAIAAYIRALQLGQHAIAADLPAEDQGRLKEFDAMTALRRPCGPRRRGRGPGSIGFSTLPCRLAGSGWPSASPGG